MCGRYKLYVWHFTDQKITFVWHFTDQKITFKELYQIMFLWISKNKKFPRILRNDQRKSVNMYTDNTQYSIIKVRHFKRIPSIGTHRVLEVSNFLLLFFKQFRLLTQLKKRMKKALTFHGTTDTGHPTSSRCKGRKIHYCKYHRCSQNSVYICLIHKECSQSV